MLRNIWIITKYELRRIYSRNSIGVIIAAFFLMTNNFFISEISNKSNVDIASIYYSFFILILIFVPILSLYSFSSENRYQVYPLLFSSPISIFELVIGKFIAVVTIYKKIMFLTIIYAIFIHFNSSNGIDWGVALLGIMGNILLGTLYLSIGFFYSSIIENPVLNVFLTYATSLAFLLMSFASENVTAYSSWIANILSELSFINHYMNFGKGIFNVQDFLYFILFIFSILWISIRSMEIKNLNR